MLKLPSRRNTPHVIQVAGLKEMLARVPAGSTSVAAALTQLASAYERTIEQHERIMRDGTLTPPARTVRSAKHARAALGPAVEALAKARETAAGARADAARKVAKAFDYTADFASAMVAAEIRAHFAGLDSTSRMQAVRAAIDAGDATTLKAIGAAPEYLSGVAGGMHGAARAKLIELHPEAKEAAANAKLLEEQEHAAARIEEVALQATADLIDFQQADSFAAAALEAVA